MKVGDSIIITWNETEIHGHLTSFDTYCLKIDDNLGNPEQILWKWVENIEVTRD